ncbi:hypothetical protein H8J86_13120 [Clostridium perfringens]|uniref:hypothetical protein n=1 Tax=Clostridium perfringens TaxID=1502 RepID=UPI0018E489E4|nr:hypothetical protein [Clostridium perfringens]MBI6006877.1 hypothetical protein [Clostridium perfringens]
MSYYAGQYNKDIPLSNKATMSMNIKRYLVDRINKNQDIVRYCRYLTKTPLLEMGIDYKDKVVEQPDLDCGLLEALSEHRDKDGNYVEYTSVETRGKILIPYAFDSNLMVKEQLFIFVSNNYATFSNTYNTGEYTFDIVITYSPTYNVLDPYGEERSFMIVDRICRMFDDMYPENSQYSEEIGDVKFNVRAIEERKAGTNGTMARVVKIIAKPITNRELVNYA